MSKYTLSVTLTTRDGRVGTEVVGSGKPMSWSEDGDDETVEAVVALHDEHGAMIDSATLDGEEWRDLESVGRSLEDVLKWVNHPAGDISFTAALDAACNGIDPDGWTDAHELVLDLQAELDALRDGTAADPGLRLRFENEVPRLLLRELTVGAIGWVLRLNGRAGKVVGVYSDADGPVYVCLPVDENGNEMESAEPFNVRFMDLNDLVVY